MVTVTGEGGQPKPNHAIYHTLRILGPSNGGVKEPVQQGCFGVLKIGIFEGSGYLGYITLGLKISNVSWGKCIFLAKYPCNNTIDNGRSWGWRILPIFDHFSNQPNEIPLSTQLSDRSVKAVFGSQKWSTLSTYPRPNLYTPPRNKGLIFGLIKGETNG